MKKELPMAQRIKRLKKGEAFMVSTEGDRQAALRVGKILFDAGAVDFQITTKERGDGFVVAAI